MNLYLVVSELLEEIVWEDWFNMVGHKETYCIAELVVARNHSQARYLAWLTDRQHYGPLDIRDMPKFKVRLKRKGVAGPERIASGEYEDDDEGLWEL